MLLKACLNGGTTRDSHPSVPQTPLELAADAAASVAAGAGAVHMHPRDADGAETLEPDYVLPAVAAVRAAIKEPVGVTTGLWAVGGDVARRMSLVEGWAGSDLPDFASVNFSEPGAAELAGLLSSLGVPVEAGIWSPDDAGRLATSGFGGHLLRILVEPGDRTLEGAVTLAASIDDALDRHGFTAPRLHHGYGPATWPVLRQAVRRGRDIRIGLEDTTVLEDGRQARGNRELVEAAARLASEV
jgi:uncharacterized protein (DUF849 family)